jgi:hypothetical protein
MKEDDRFLQQIPDHLRTLYCLLPLGEWISSVFKQEFGQHHQEVATGQQKFMAQ